MTEIRVESQQTADYSEMQGFAAAGLTDGVTPVSSPPSNSQISQALVRDPIVGSLHSEPDIDTIMPLPGSNRISFRGGPRSPVPTGPNSFLLSGESGRGMEDSDDSEEWYQQSGGLQHSGSQPHEYTSGGFTNVEVYTFLILLHQIY